MAEPLHVVVDDDTETIRVDPDTGTVETDQADGGVVVQLDARKKSDDAEEDGWFANLADKIDAQQLGTIANELYDAVTADDLSRQDYLAIHARGLDLLGTQLKEPRSSVSDGAAVDGMSTVTNPLLLEAVLKGWANAQAELLPASGPVKIKDDGDETTAEDDLADRFERDMNHWFTTTAAEYYPDTSHMLLWGTYLGGSGFKKVYRCPMRRRPVSESVAAKNLIVSDSTKDFRSCARITHEIPMRSSVMKRMKFIGAYRDVDLTQPTPTPNIVDEKIAAMQGTTTAKTRPEDQPYTLWETQCELDLDEFIPKASKLKGEGIPVPFVVTLDKDTREVLAIRRDWDEDDEQCERLRMYVKYPYIPGPGFYGTGLLNVLGNSSAAMTAAWREALDVGMFANFPAGFIAKLGSRQNTSDMRLGPGEWKQIETGQLPINQVLLPNPYKDVTPGLMALIDKITEQSKSVGGSAEIPVGEGLQNVPVGSMLAAIEQATKIMAAAHKGMHTAQSLELELIIDLFRANPEDFWRSNKVCPKNYWNEQKFNAALENCNLVPVSDPNVPSHIHRIAKALALIQLNQAFPGKMDADEILKRCLRAIHEDPQGLVLPPQAAPAAPEPKAIEAQAKVLTAQTNAKTAEAKAAALPIELEIKKQGLEGQQRVAELNIRREEIIHQGDAAHQAAQAGLEREKQGLQAVKVAHDITQDHHDRAVDVAQHGLAAGTAAHDKTMDVAGHALAVHEVLHPPKPAAPKKK